MVFLVLPSDTLGSPILLLGAPPLDSRLHYAFASGGLHPQLTALGLLELSACRYKPENCISLGWVLAQDWLMQDIEVCPFSWAGTSSGASLILQIPARSGWRLGLTCTPLGFFPLALLFPWFLYQFLLGTCSCKLICMGILLSVSASGETNLSGFHQMEDAFNKTKGLVIK